VRVLARMLGLRRRAERGQCEQQVAGDPAGVGEVAGRVMAVRREVCVRAVGDRDREQRAPDEPERHAVGPEVAGGEDHEGEDRKIADRVRETDGLIDDRPSVTRLEEVAEEEEPAGEERRRRDDQCVDGDAGPRHRRDLLGQE
jgi:hypothetical protein